MLAPQHPGRHRAPRHSSAAAHLHRQRPPTGWQIPGNSDGRIRQRSRRLGRRQVQRVLRRALHVQLRHVAVAERQGQSEVGEEPAHLQELPDAAQRHVQLRGGGAVRRVRYEPQHAAARARQARGHRTGQAVPGCRRARSVFHGPLNEQLGRPTRIASGNIAQHLAHAHSRRTASAVKMIAL